MIRNLFLRIRFAFIAFVFTISLIYITLLSGEFALAYVTRPTGADLERLKNLSNRIEYQDIKQRKAALDDGFKPLITPSNVESRSSIKSLALEYGVAPVAPQPHRKLYLCNEGYGLIRYTSDRFGFRNPDEAWDKKADIVLIGDSFVHGACVEDADIISRNLGSNLNALNLGTIGNNPINYASIAKLFIPKTKPNFVALVFYSNDFNAGSLFSYNYLMNFVKTPTYFKDGSDDLKIHGNILQFFEEAEKIAIPEVLKDLDGTALKKKFSPSDRYLSGQRFELRLVKDHLTGLYRKFFPESSLSFSTKLAIDTVIDACKNNKCTPIVAFIPPSEKWNPNPTARLYSELISNYSKSKNVEFLDAKPILSPLGDEAYAIKGGHLSPQGYKAFSDALGNWIKQNNPIKTAQ